MAVTPFTPFASLLGGIIIGIAAVLLMLATGRIAGISGIAARLFPPYQDTELTGRLAFITGLIVAPLVVLLVTGRAPVRTVQSSDFALIIAGLLVGFGSVWGNGCTSGHGVCGIARLSLRSMVATAVFMASAFVTVFITRHCL
ncbi:MAG: YeeE/YedE family protein [Bradyrhizobiaceae bacterium]|nr:MAG: YeeE/YedE family protein [Bradyrhizobiaceae bacterium]